MKVERYVPTGVLKPFIKSFTVIESEDGMVNKILPDTSIVLAFRYKGTTFTGADGRMHLPASAVSGLTKSARVLGYSKEAAVLLAHFKEAGMAAFSHSPLHELFGLHVSLDHLIHRRTLNEVEERLAEAKDNLQRFLIVEHFMLSQLKGTQPDQLVRAAIEEIRSAKGTLRIKDLAISLSISQDSFEKRFRQAIGTSPKQFAKIVRLQNLIHGYAHSHNLTATALMAGYFDQAHFIRDFKSFTGQTPGEFFNTPSLL